MEARSLECCSQILPFRIPRSARAEGRGTRCRRQTELNFSAGWGLLLVQEFWDRFCHGLKSLHIPQQNQTDTDHRAKAEGDTWNPQSKDLVQTGKREQVKGGRNLFTRWRTASGWIYTSSPCVISMEKPLGIQSWGSRSVEMTLRDGVRQIWIWHLALSATNYKTQASQLTKVPAFPAVRWVSSLHTLQGYCRGGQKCIKSTCHTVGKWRLSTLVSFWGKPHFPRFLGKFRPLFLHVSSNLPSFSFLPNSLSPSNSSRLHTISIKKFSVSYWFLTLFWNIPTPFSSTAYEWV